MKRPLHVSATLAVLFLACNSSQEQAAAPCDAPAECYKGIDAQAFAGPIECLKSTTTQGYCTHECTTDADCCAVTGECITNVRQVCAPFESTGKKYCFVSCEPGDITKATSDNTADADAFCRKFAADAFTCRSTGGGSENRKVCFPSG